MKKTGQEILVDVFKSRFHSKASSIVKDGFAKQKITAFESLEPKEQADIGQALIETTFKELFDKEIIAGMKSRFILHFAINNAIDTMKTMMQTNVGMEINPLLEESVSKIDSISKKVSKSDTTKFCFECSGLLTGKLIMLIETDDAVIFSKTLMKHMLGVQAENNNMDSEKISAIYEFFNVIFPEILDIVGNAFDNSVFFTPLFFEDFKTRFMPNGIIKTPQNIHSTSLTITIESVKTVGKIYFLNE